MTFSSDDGSIYLLYLVLSTPIIIIFPLVVRAISRLRLRRLARSRTIIAVYEPPARLTPSEMGYIYDGGIGVREFIATVFDLEYRDIITIDQRGGLSLAPSVTEERPLKDHEKYLVNLIRHNEYTSILQNPSITHSHTFRRYVSQCLVSRGLMHENFYMRILFGTLRMIRFVFFYYSSLIIIGTMSLLFVSPLAISEVLFMCIMSLIGFTLMFAPMYISLGIILTFIYVKLDGMHWIGTKRLKKAWHDIEGYRIYIKQAQLNRLNFTSEELRIKALEKDFSYAVALGMKIDWKSRFSADKNTTS